MVDTIKCPCEECISFAICYHQYELNCEDLYKFVCQIYKGSFYGYRRGAGVAVNELYGKWIKNSNHPSWLIELSDTKHQFRSNHLNAE